MYVPLFAGLGFPLAFLGSEQSNVNELLRGVISTTLILKTFHLQFRQLFFILEITKDNFLMTENKKQGWALWGEILPLFRRMAWFKLITFKDVLFDSVELGLRCQSVFLIFTFPHSGAAELISPNTLFFQVTPAKVLEGVRRKLKIQQKRDIKRSVKALEVLTLCFLLFLALLQQKSLQSEPYAGAGKCCGNSHWSGVCHSSSWLTPINWLKCWGEPSQGSLSTCPWNQFGVQGSKVETNPIPKEQKLFLFRPSFGR